MKTSAPASCSSQAIGAPVASTIAAGRLDALGADAVAGDERHGDALGILAHGVISSTGTTRKLAGRDSNPD